MTDPDARDENANADGGGNPAAPADWRIALRVEPDAEGPSAGKLKLAATEDQVGHSAVGMTSVYATVFG